MCNGYLVIAVCNFDDIPVQFFRSLRAATKAARSLAPPKVNPLGSMDITGFIGAKVLPFKNGKPHGQATFYEVKRESSHPQRRQNPSHLRRRDKPQ